MSNFAPIVHRPLDAPDAADCLLRYGVEFVSPKVQQLHNFERLCSSLVREQQRILNGVDTDLAPAKPAIMYAPSAFLASPLTDRQIIAINERETHRVAEYCIKVQSRLAKVPIKESGERFAHIPSAFQAAKLTVSFSGIPYPEVSGEWANKPQEFWVREGLLKRLLIMGRILQTIGLQLHFVEAFRPVGVQEGMFKRRLSYTKSQHPNWNESQILAESCSKTAYTPRLAAHKGGAAVDILLRDIQTGGLLDFGHQYPDGGVIVFPRTPFVTAEQWRNRQLLQVSAGLSGLTLYVGEDWHVSFGDVTASLDENGEVKKGYVAQYGPAKDFDHQTGLITDTHAPHEMDRIFEI